MTDQGLSPSTITFNTCASAFAGVSRWREALSVVQDALCGVGRGCNCTELALAGEHSES